MLWNQSDLEPYKGPTAVDNTTTAKKRAEREAIARDVEAFLRNGGKITVLDVEETGYEEGRQNFVINARTSSGAT